MTPHNTTKPVKTTSRNRVEEQFPREFPTGFFGVLCGITAALVLCSVFPAQLDPARVVTKIGLLPDNAVAVSANYRAKIFYLLSYILGPGLCLMALVWLRDRIRRPGLLIIGTALWSVVIYRVLGVQMDAPGPEVLALSLAVAFPVLLCWLAMRGKEAGRPQSHGDASGNETQGPEPGRVVRYLAYLGALFVIAIVLLPRSFGTLVRGLEHIHHIVSFILGPALYSRFGQGLVPGIDFFTQYGVGQGFIFSWLVSTTPAQTVLNYMVFFIGAMLFFSFTSFHLLYSTSRSAGWALLMTLAALVLQFHFAGRHFWDPSSHFIRYPLLCVVAYLFVRSNRDRANWLLWALLSAAVGFSLFWNTETGIYLFLASFLSVCLMGGLRPSALARSSLVACGALAVFLLLSAFAFGGRALSLAYLQGVIAPIRFFSSGFSGLQMDWVPGWVYVYNLLSPALCLFSVGWAFHRTCLGRDEGTVPNLDVLVIMGFLSLAFFMKDLNRSIVGVWCVDSYPALIVMGWWGLHLVRSFGRVKAIVSVKNIVTACLVVLLVLFVYAPHETRYKNGLKYGLRSYLTYPSILNVGTRVVNPAAIPGQPFDLSGFVKEADAKLITDRVKPGEPAAVFHYMDWAYLIASQRPPRFPFLPSSFTFTFDQLDRMKSYRDEYIFLPRNVVPPLRIANRQLVNEHFDDLLTNHFVLDAVGVDLTAYRRIH